MEKEDIKIKKSAIEKLLKLSLRLPGKYNMGYHFGIRVVCEWLLQTRKEYPYQLNEEERRAATD